jgi:AcrR family transcriptional regulator
MELSRRELTKQQNRQTILAAARQVFSGMGYDAATVRDIVKATPLASGTFYNYFKSKEEIYRAMLDDIARDLRPLLAAARRDAVTAEDFIGGTFQAFFTFAADRAAEMNMLRSTHLRLNTPQMIAAFAELRRGLKAAVAGGVLECPDVRLAMTAMVGVGFELAGQVMAHKTPAPDAADFATRLFLQGVAARPEISPALP